MNKNPIDMFIEGTKDKDPNRTYIIWKDYPFLVLKEKTYVVIRRRVVVDVTGENIGPDSTQDELELWTSLNIGRIEPSMRRLIQEAASNINMLDEADAWLEGM